MGIRPAKLEVMTKKALQRALETAAAHLEARRLADVAAECQTILKHAPNQPEAVRLWSLAAYFGGDLATAEALTRRLLKIAPRHIDSHNNLSVILWQQQRPQEAEAAARKALSLDQRHPMAWNNLGNALQGQGRYEEAADAYRKLLDFNPSDARAANNLGTALQALGRMTEAAEAHRQALALAPGDAGALMNLGAALNIMGRPAEALECLQQARERAPRSAQVIHNLASVFIELCQWEGAEALCREALALDPRYLKAMGNLATTFSKRHRYADAEATLRDALAISPASALVLSQLGGVLMCQGRAEEAIAFHRQAASLEPTNLPLQNRALLCEQYLPGVTTASLAEAHERWRQRQNLPAETPHAWLNSRDRNRPLRLGFLSADLGHHPVGFLLIRTIEHLAPEEATIICYNDRTTIDAMNQRFRNAAAEWRDVRGLSNPELTEQIRRDQVDILFDLDGHTSPRLPVFAARAAPIQVSWIGYVGTTGLPQMDYLVADRHQVLEGTEANYREKVFRLPDGYICFDPPVEAPEVGPLPADRNGFITFGCFNNLVKINSQVVALWSQILTRVPGSRLLLKFYALADPPVRHRLLNDFAAHGVSGDRLQLLPGGSRAELLAQYNEIDLALDTFPYGGGLTTCEALWMGVPVITCPGETFAGRHALGHIANAGLAGTIARDFEDYADLAVTWAKDPARLAALRSGLRAQVAASPLCDGPRFAGHLMRGLREIWEEWALRSCP